MTDAERLPEPIVKGRDSLRPWALIARFCSLVGAWGALRLEVPILVQLLLVVFAAVWWQIAEDKSDWD